jgi:hypothetical protein
VSSPDETVEPSIVDALAADAVPDEYPAGSPLLLPMLQIRPRSRRAAFKRKYAEFAKMQAQVQVMKAKLDNLPADDESTPATTQRMELWANVDDYYQLIDEMLAMAAVNPDHYREWSDTVDDAGLVEVFTVYSKRAQPGEASSSTG